MSLSNEFSGRSSPLLRPSLNKKGTGRTYRYGEIRDKNRKSKTVSFGTIESKTFETIRVKMDVVNALGLGWTCLEQMKPIPVDQYEGQRPSKDRSKSEKLQTSPKERRKMLKNSAAEHQQRLGIKEEERLQEKVMKLFVLPTKIIPGAVGELLAGGTPRAA